LISTKATVACSPSEQNGLLSLSYLPSPSPPPSSSGAIKVWLAALPENPRLKGGGAGEIAKSRARSPPSPQQPTLMRWFGVLAGRLAGGLQCTALLTRPRGRRAERERRFPLTTRRRGESLLVPPSFYLGPSLHCAPSSSPRLCAGSPLLSSTPRPSAPFARGENKFMGGNFYLGVEASRVFRNGANGNGFDWTEGLWEETAAHFFQPFLPMRGIWSAVQHFAAVVS